MNFPSVLVATTYLSDLPDCLISVACATVGNMKFLWLVFDLHLVSDIDGNSAALVSSVPSSAVSTSSSGMSTPVVTPIFRQCMGYDPMDPKFPFFSVVDLIP